MKRLFLILVLALFTSTAWGQVFPYVQQFTRAGVTSSGWPRNVTAGDVLVGCIASVGAAKLLDAADAQFMQKEALREVEARVFKNPNVIGGNAKFGTPERVNVYEAVRQLQRLADKSEYGGSRLTQAFGKDAANRILEDMYSAQRSGVKYLNQQVWAKRIAKALGAAGVGYEVTKGLLASGSQ